MRPEQDRRHSMYGRGRPKPPPAIMLFTRRKHGLVVSIETRLGARQKKQKGRHALDICSRRMRGGTYTGLDTHSSRRPCCVCSETSSHRASRFPTVTTRPRSRVKPNVLTPVAPRRHPGAAKMQLTGPLGRHSTRLPDCQTARQLTARMPATASLPAHCAKKSPPTRPHTTSDVNQA